MRLLSLSLPRGSTKRSTLWRSLVEVVDPSVQEDLALQTPHKPGTLSSSRIVRARNDQNTIAEAQIKSSG